MAWVSLLTRQGTAMRALLPLRAFFIASLAISTSLTAVENIVHDDSAAAVWVKSYFSLSHKATSV